MRIEQKMCEHKIFQFQSTANAIICVDQGFASKNFCVSCLTSTFDSAAEESVQAGVF